jgi:siroheme synthase
MLGRMVQSLFGLAPSFGIKIVVHVTRHKTNEVTITLNASLRRHSLSSPLIMIIGEQFSRYLPIFQTRALHYKRP